MALDRPARQIATPLKVLGFGEIEEGQTVVCHDGLLVGVDTQAIDNDRFSAQSKNASVMHAGMAVAIHSSGSGIVAASAADGTKPAVGLLVDDVSPDFAVEVQASDPLELADWRAVTGTQLLTRGRYYLDPTTPGMLTAIAPTAVGQVVQPIGYAISPNTLKINPLPPVLL